jgi:GH24 family phage-related lysozyme (muramidase)
MPAREVDFKTYAAWNREQEGRVVVEDTHLPYDDATGLPVKKGEPLQGKLTIGYGHLVGEGEDYWSGLSEEQAVRLHANDLKRHAIRAAAVVGEQKFTSLPRTDQIKLIEHEWNGGLNNYKGFAQAVLQGDEKRQLEEHHRYVVQRDKDGNVLSKKPLGRNEAWEQLFYPEAAAARQDPKTEAVRRADPAYAHKDAEEEGLGPKLFSSDKFQQMDPEKRVAFLGGMDPRFQAIIDREPERARKMADEFAELGALEDDASVLDSFAGGFELGIGMAAQTTSNAIKIIEDAGLIETKADDDLLVWANQRQISGRDQIGTDWQDQVAAILGGIPGGIAVPAAATGAAVLALPALGAGATTTALLAPVLGYGTAGYIAARHEGADKALRRAAIDGTTSLLGPLGQHLPRAARVAMESAVNYALSYQDDPTKRGIEALSLGLLAGIPGKRPPIWAMKQAGIKPESFEGAAEALDDSARAADARKLVTDQLEKPLPMAIWSQDGHRYDTLGDALKDEGAAINRTAPYEIAPQDMADIDMVRFKNRADETAKDPRELVVKTETDAPSVEYAPGPGHIRARPWGFDEDVASAGASNWNEPSGGGAGPAHIGQWRREPRPEQRGARGIFSAKQKKPGEILAPFAQAFGFTVERGNVTGAGPTTLGWWWRATREMKVLRRQNLQVAAHEAGHDLAYTQPALRRMIEGPDFQADMQRMVTVLTQAAGQPITGPNGGVNISAIFQHQNALPPELRYIPELLSVSYDRASVSEGMAETMRLFLTQNRFEFNGQQRTLAQHIPNVHRRLTEWVSSLPKAQRKALERFQREAHAFVNEDAELSINRTVGRDMSTDAALESAAAKIRQEWVDDLSGLENIWKQTKFDGEMVGDSWVQGFRQLRGVGSIMEGLIRRGAPRFIDDPNRPGKRMIDPDGSGPALREALALAGTTKAQREEAGRYVQAYQSEELAAQGRENLLQPEQIAAGLAIADRRPELRQMVSQLEDIARRVADFGEEAGIFGAEDRARWGRSRFIHSFMRDMGDQLETNGGSIMAANAATRRLAGSDRNLRKPWEELILDTHARTIKLAMENIAKRDFVDTILEPGRGGGRFIETYAPYRASRGGQTIPEAIGNIGPRNGPDWMTVWRDGKQHSYRLKDPLAVRSLMMLRRPAAIFKWWNNLQSLKRGAITIAPGFMAAAFAKDIGMHAMVSKTGGFALTKMLGGLKSTLLQDRHYREFMMNGGGFSSLYGNQESTIRDIRRFAQRQGMDPRYLLVTPSDLMKPLHLLSHALENAGRVAEYKAARRQGQAAKHAVYLGREVNTDFARRGEMAGMRFLSETIPFFGAMIQSHDKLARGLITDETHKLATGLKMGLLALASVGLYEYNRRYAPEYEEDVPDWARAAFWHFYIPMEDANGNRMRDAKGRLANHHFTMPKIFEPGLLATMAERTMMELHKSTDRDWAQYGLDIAGLSLSSFGINVADRSYPLPLPIGVDVLVEQGANRVLFTGNPIESMEMAAREASYRRKADTPAALQAWGELSQDFPIPDWLKSPARSEALLRGFFGEWVTIADLLTEKRFNDAAPTRSVDELPVVGKFYQRPDKYDRSENEFYERYRKVEEIVKTNDYLREQAFTPEKREALLERRRDPENRVAAGLEPTLDRTRAKLADINQKIETIKLLPAGKMTPDEKAAKIRELIGKRRLIMSGANKASERVEQRYR